MNKDFETNFFETLVDLHKIDKSEIASLKTAIKRKNPNFVKDVTSRNFKGASDNNISQIAEAYAKSFSRELEKSNSGKFTFSKRLLQTDLKNTAARNGPDLNNRIKKPFVSVETPKPKLDTPVEPSVNKQSETKIKSNDEFEF